MSIRIGRTLMVRSWRPTWRRVETRTTSFGQQVQHDRLVGVLEVPVTKYSLQLGEQQHRFDANLRITRPPHVADRVDEARERLLKALALRGVELRLDRDGLSNDRDQIAVLCPRGSGFSQPGADHLAVGFGRKGRQLVPAGAKSLSPSISSTMMSDFVLKWL